MMVGKLFLDLGEDYAFDIRRAKEVAEGVVVVTQPEPPVQIDNISGPYQTASGVPYFLGEGNRTGLCWIGFDIVGDPAPDFFTPLVAFMNNPSVDQVSKDEVQAQADAIGCGS